VGNEIQPCIRQRCTVTFSVQRITHAITPQP